MIKKLHSTRWPKVSIIISNFNGLQLDLVIDSLTSVLKCDYPNYEVFLVDNASTDKTVQVIRRKFGKNIRLKIIQNPVNMYSKGLNLGLDYATGEYVAFFNNDIEYKAGYFQKIIRIFKDYPKVYLIQGKLVYYYDHKLIDSAGESMDIYGNPVTIGAWEIDNGQFNKLSETLSAAGSASVVRKDAIGLVGKFDEDYGIGYEDMDFALRLRLKGYKVFYAPDAVMYHKRGKTDLSPLVRVKVRWHFNKNRLATMIKNYPALLLFKALPVTILLYIVAAIWEILIRRKFKLGLTRFTAILWIIRHLPTLFKKRLDIRKNVNKIGEEKMLNLLSNRSLLKSFQSFVRTK